MATPSRFLLALCLLVAGCADEPPSDGPLGLYMVERGDTLVDLARRFAVPGGWKRLAELNGIERPERLQAERRLKVPMPAGGAAGLEPYTPALRLEAPLVPCAVRRYVQEAAPPAASVRPVHCVAGPGDLMVCKGGNDQQPDAIRLLDGGRLVGSWPAPSFVGTVDDFRVCEADLDADGRPELVVANHDWSGNGLGIGFWSVAILADPRGPEAPLRFTVADFGDGSFLAAPGGGCEVLATSWEAGVDPLRGDGTYFVGRRFRYAAGRLVPLDVPLLARRLVTYFRGTGDDLEGRPAEWLAPGETELWDVEPSLVGAPATLLSGVVRSARAAPSDEASAAHVLELEGPLGASLVVSLYHATEGEAALAVQLGDVASGRLFPGGYQPPDLDGWLRGRPARLLDAGEGGPGHLWVDPSR